ncbi:uncharacterized protein THITE_114136 [Thermothielavioides terrestris NRRL 8126]|uniref:Uncharacterized protein n=1 Tax=Thermothielavioides terrestris (strain ATCC 38088 / NRRL 8126) TaxID=578455 RepID=G2R9A9_THETT|nr:uncharacterized protein THITE_114136 [Thermothielavioides terrestris NRRL 8126]AEO69507.1 hypothetical protein THITE_114136 [Thermothielavioides terrestris NRRL 8126]
MQVRICVVAEDDATAAGGPSTLPPPALATLPPATQDGNASCAFDSLPELVERVVEDWAGYNISLLVDTCPGVCELVYGSGNPDISGIGAMYSYAIQGVSSLLFGPILGMLALYVGSDPDSDSFLALPPKLWVTETFAPTARSVHQTNIIVAFSVLFAALIRVRQACPVAERDFLQRLVGYEVLVSLICTLSYLPIHESSKQRKTVLCCYVLGTIIMVFIALDWTDLGDEPYASAFQAITKYCVQQQDWPVPEISFVPPPTSSETATSEGIWVEMSTMEFLLAMSPIWLFVVPLPLACCFPRFAAIFLIPHMLLLAGVLTVAAVAVAAVCIPLFVLGSAVFALLTRPYKAACRTLRVGPLRLGAVLIAAGFTALGASLAWIIFGAMRIQRQELGGFGQVAAVLAWIPTAQDALLAVSASFDGTERESQGAISMRYNRARLPRNPSRPGSHSPSRLSLLERRDSASEIRVQPLIQ